MTSNSNVLAKATSASRSWLSPKVYAKFWRLHFYAGFIMTPLIIWLCVTGILYIITPQIEPLLYAHLLQVTPGSQQTGMDAQLRAAASAYPDLVPTAFHPSKGPDKSSYVVMSTHMEAHMTGMRHSGPTDNVDVFVNPYTAEVLGSMREDKRYSRIMMDLHGNLYLGDFGRVLTELGTVWGLALLLTGVYLWLPQRTSRIWGVWLPRIRQWKGRIWWRDFHSVGGTYLSVLVAAFLMTGLMISYSSGTIFALTRVILRQLPPAVPKTVQSTPVTGQSPLPLDSLIPLVQSNNMLQSYMITLPVTPTGVYTISADNGMSKAEQRHDLSVDQYSGRQLFSTSWAQYPLLTKITVWGLGFHFGDLAGIFNELLGILACLGLIFFTVSGVVMWWKRRPASAWGLPKPVQGGMKPFPRGLIILMVVLSILLPALGISLLVALGIDWLVLRTLARGRSQKTDSQVANG